MPTIPPIAQPVPPSRTGWRGAFDRRGGESGFGGDTGWTGEDWNFDFTQAVDGFVYGYAQGRPSKERCRLAASHFDVLFYVRAADGEFRAVGLYRNAEYLDDRDERPDGPFREAIATLRASGVWERRCSAIRSVLGDGEVKRFEHDRPIRWRVRADHIDVYEPAIPIAHDVVGGPMNHRFGTAYHKGVRLDLLQEAVASDLSADPLLEILLGPTFEGGRRLVATHYRRERDSAFIRAIKRARAEKGRLCCELCAFDFVEEYGEIGRGYIEAHHRRPLAEAADEGRVTAPEDIILLCANCHRIEHRRLAFEARRDSAVQAR